MSELLFGFRDLPNIRDPNRNVLLNIGSFFMNDEYVRKFNQKRYSFGSLICYSLFVVV